MEFISPKGENALSNIVHDTRMYKWKCPKCRHEIISPPPSNPFIIHAMLCPTQNLRRSKSQTAKQVQTFVSFRIFLWLKKMINILLKILFNSPLIQARRPQKAARPIQK
ncbi:MAG: hypothetical protein PHY82_11890, partial [Lentisphaeria bacterium]|nr:hypothetical protein [Lentisphaeria bacterium]